MQHVHLHIAGMRMRNLVTCGLRSGGWLRLLIDSTDMHANTDPPHTHTCMLACRQQADKFLAATKTPHTHTEHRQWSESMGFSNYPGMSHTLKVTISFMIF